MSYSFLKQLQSFINRRIRALQGDINNFVVKSYTNQQKRKTNHIYLFIIVQSRIRFFVQNEAFFLLSHRIHGLTKPAKNHRKMPKISRRSLQISRSLSLKSSYRSQILKILLRSLSYYPNLSSPTFFQWAVLEFAPLFNYWQIELI